MVRVRAEEIDRPKGGAEKKKDGAARKHGQLAQKGATELCGV